MSRPPGLDADLVVVGAGPVGLATAIEAAQAGLRVCALDPRPHPTDKACGEGLMPAARAALLRLGVEPSGMPLRGIRYLTAGAAGAGATAVFRGGPGLGVRRTALSAALGERARQAGVRIVTGRAGAVLPGVGCVEVAGLRARWVVAADGLHSPLRRALGLHMPAPGAVRFGLRRHFRVRAWTDLVEVHWAARAEAYVTPVAEDLVGVAVLCPSGGTYDGWLGGFPRLLDSLSGSCPVTEVRGAGPLRQVAAQRVSGRVLLVGDAAGYLDALTGEGIATGLACARELVACLVRDQPDAYESAWWRTTRRYRALTSVLLWSAGRPAVRRMIVPAAERLPVVFSALVNALG